MLEVTSFAFNPFQENTYVLHDDTGACVIIDPGCLEAHECEELAAFISAKNLKPERIINTHAHIDHVLGAKWVKERYQIPFMIPLKEVPVFEAIPSYAAMYGMASYSATTVDEFIDSQDTITFGNTTLKVLQVPGHSPGHVAFYHPEAALVVNGDVLFRESIGRTDLPGGHLPTLLASIKTQLFTLPDEVVVYTGHGPSTTVGHEKNHNPFLQDQ